MKKKLYVVLVILVSIAANAQRFGVKGGINIANMTGDDMDGAKSIVGFNVGGLAEFALSDKLYLQPELLLSMRGTSGDTEIEGVAATMDMKPIYIDIPVKLLYKINLNKGYLGIAAGPYVGIGVAGKVSMAANGVSISYDLFKPIEGADEAVLNRFDFGLTAGVSYELNNGLFFGADFNAGLANVPNLDDVSVHNSVISIGLGYKF